MGSTMKTFIWRVTIVTLLASNIAGMYALSFNLRDHDAASADLFMGLINDVSDVRGAISDVADRQEEHQESLRGLWNSALISQDKAMYASNTASMAYHEMLAMAKTAHWHSGQKTIEVPK